MLWDRGHDYFFNQTETLRDSNHWIRAISSYDHGVEVQTLG